MKRAPATEMKHRSQSHGDLRVGQRTAASNAACRETRHVFSLRTEAPYYSTGEPTSGLLQVGEDLP